GAIGTAALRLMLERAIHPRSLILCDVQAKAAELKRLAHDIRTDFGFRGDIEVARSSGKVPDEVYRSRFIMGSTSVAGALHVDRLRPGTLVVDDPFPHCSDTERAIGRMSSRGDALLVEGGFVAPPGAIDWQVTLAANLATMIGKNPASLLPGS